MAEKKTTKPTGMKICKVQLPTEEHASMVYAAALCGVRGQQYIRDAIKEKVAKDLKEKGKI